MSKTRSATSRGTWTISFGKSRNVSGARDLLAGRDDVVEQPAAVHARVVRPERRADRARDPVDHHRRQQVVVRDAARVRPGGRTSRRSSSSARPASRTARRRASAAACPGLRCSRPLPASSLQLRARRGLESGHGPGRRSGIMYRCSARTASGYACPCGADVRAPVAAGHQVLLVPERPHQRVERVAHVGGPGTPAGRTRTVAGQRRARRAGSARAAPGSRGGTPTRCSASRAAAAAAARHPRRCVQPVHVELREAEQLVLGRPPVVPSRQ